MADNISSVDDDTPSVGRAPAKKRRTSANTSSRGVANLTPEQLARKRANDREAQRAIRERTKAHIDSLNARIHELESQQPYHELQVVLRQKEAIQAENEDIKRRLSSVMAIIQPILSAQGLNELAAAAERSPLALHAPEADQPPGHLQPPDNRPYHDIPVGHPHGDAQSPGSQASVGRHWQFPGVPPTSHVRGWPAAPNASFDQQRNIQPDLASYAPSDERLGVDFLLQDGAQRIPNIRNGTAPHPSSVSPELHGAQAGYDRLAAYAMLPRTTEATCLLDNLLLGFLAERQQLAAEGVSSKILVGPPYPNFTVLVNPRTTTQSHPLSKVFTDILPTFPDISGLPEQVAIVYVMFLLMRWQIEPTQENYERLPEWITPRPSQLFTPHAAWMDNLPWPRLRDRMVQSPTPVPFDTFFIPYTTTVSLNWPYEPRDCLLPAGKLDAVVAGSGQASMSPDPTTAATAVVGGEELYMINPAFESHLRNLGNWSLGAAFRDAFPELADCVSIR